MSVQLSRSSLALVLGVREEETGLEHSRSGKQLLAELKTENGRSVWDRRLVQTVSGLQLLGWLDNSTLLLGGSASNLEALRDAWIRRTLRAPRGFFIRAMGIATPSQEILHNALGSLIQERKIYHTGEGYFIVTPHTYFIAGNRGEQNYPWVLCEEHATALAPVTYLVSVKNYDEPVKEEKFLPDGAPHCKSCHCFRQQEVEKQQSEQWLSMKEIPGQRNCKEHKPSIQHRATSTSVGPQGSERGRIKEKQNHIRKFGLSLFRRKTKNEGTKRTYGTFSAQFPPEEWPVRDESSLGNIPRDVEHQLIKRINPELTVENLVRHTLLMKKLGRENTDLYHNTSSMEQLISKHRHHSKSSWQKALVGPQQQRRAQSSREKKRLKHRGSLQTSEGLLKTKSDPRTKEMANPRRNEGEQKLPEKPNIQPCRSSNPTRHFYKNRVNNSLSKVSSVEHHHAQYTIINSLGTEGYHRVGRRSQSRDSSTRVCGAVSVRERAKDRIQINAVCNIRPSEADSKDQPQSCAVTTESQDRTYRRHHIPASCQTHDYPSKSQTPVSSTGDHISNHTHSPGQAARKSDLQEREECVNVTEHEVSHNYGDDSVPQIWRDWPLKQAWNPAIPTTANSGSVEMLLNQSHPPRTQLMYQVEACQSENGAVRQSDTDGGQSATFTDEDQTLYQRELDEDDACSSLYLNDDAEFTVCNQLPTTLPGLGCSNNPGSEGVPAVLSNESWLLTKILLQEQQTETCAFSEQQVASWVEVNNNSLGQSKPFCGKEFCTELLVNSIFDYCDATGPDSGPESPRNMRNKGIRSHANQENWAVHQGMKAQLMRNLERNLGFLHSHNNALLQTSHDENTHLEVLENHSITGDSGIDSPRTRVSLASSNSIGLDSLKRRGLMQSYGTLNSTERSGLLSQYPLLQLTPVMNV
ncbi:storkhead-box protein 1 isoform X2 [Scyliorhinus torazame]|uniref:storkhead-box protein 1 isoform X2 n=1 Tax=Scyliorhinus torazame TaxID=75743 RepID=UPI003B5A8C4E